MAVTRTRVVEAAIETFGTLGFDATSTRLLARKAGTSLTAIRYHFGSKEGLYLAAAEEIAAGIRDRLAVTMSTVNREAPSGESAEALLGAIGGLFEALASKFLGGLPDRWATFITREQLEPGGAFEILFSAMRPLFDRLSELMGSVIGRPHDSIEARLLAISLFGQVAVFRSHRATALRILGWREYGAVERERVRATVRHNVVTLMRGLATAELPSSARSASRLQSTSPRRRPARRAIVATPTALGRGSSTR